MELPWTTTCLMDLAISQHLAEVLVMTHAVWMYLAPVVLLPLSCVTATTSALSLEIAAGISFWLKVVLVSRGYSCGCY